MFDVGLPEFFVLGLVALLVFGPERLPEVAVQAARLIRRLKGMAESARSELTADLEPHMRELKELRELDPRKMAKRYIIDPVDEDGSLKDLRSKNLLDPSSPSKKADRVKKRAATAAEGAGPAAVAAATEESAPSTNGSAAVARGEEPTSNVSAEPADGPALPPAMAPAVTPSGERPPYDLDAT